MTDYASATTRVQAIDPVRTIPAKGHIITSASTFGLTCSGEKRGPGGARLRSSYTNCGATRDLVTTARGINVYVAAAAALCVARLAPKLLVLQVPSGAGHASAKTSQGAAQGLAASMALLTCQERDEVRKRHVLASGSFPLSRVNEWDEVAPAACPDVVREQPKLAESLTLFVWLRTADGTEGLDEGSCTFCDGVHSPTVATTTDVRAGPERA